MTCPKCGRDKLVYQDSFGTTVKRAGKVGAGGIAGGALGAAVGGPAGALVGALVGGGLGSKRSKKDKQYWECPSCHYFEFRD